MTIHAGCVARPVEVVPSSRWKSEPKFATFKPYHPGAKKTTNMLHALHGDITWNQSWQVLYLCYSLLICWVCPLILLYKYWGSKLDAINIDSPHLSIVATWAIYLWVQKYSSCAEWICSQMARERALPLVKHCSALRKTRASDVSKSLRSWAEENYHSLNVSHNLFKILQNI